MHRRTALKLLSLGLMSTFLPDNLFGWDSHAEEELKRGYFGTYSLVELSVR